RQTRFSRDWSSDVCSSDLAHGFRSWACPAPISSRVAMPSMARKNGCPYRIWKKRSAPYFTSQCCGEKGGTHDINPFRDHQKGYQPTPLGFPAELHQSGNRQRIANRVIGVRECSTYP